MPQAPKRALIVRGDWRHRAPAKATGLIIAFLQRHGYVVAVSNDLDVYTHAALMAGTDLLVPCWTTSLPTDDQVAGLCRAVESGTGFVGWHGAAVDSLRPSPAYAQLTGAVFAARPRDVHEHSIVLAPACRDHEIVSGLPAEITIEGEQLWTLSDPYNEVLATTTIPARDGDAWSDAVTVPAIWTRRWGAGRVVMCSPGHHAPAFETPEIRTVVERGLLWASR
jgi:type 1 glutamine amidotransferase